MMNNVRATAVRLEDGRLIVELCDGDVLIVPLDDFPNLRAASHEQLQRVRISPSGHGLHWDELDEDLSVVELMRNYKKFRR
ncbi:DUF2442 domain-containing protein [Paraburkholderia tropica]|uniref:DUF2442 domain-containing protein n=1 Tax=Paraburkholderia tropica TaxID=92647 RepID=UPI0015900E5C|nr:DUF2442 domain-containing protein [Paraburkholderia tropica]